MTGGDHLAALRWLPWRRGDVDRASALAALGAVGLGERAGDPVSTLAAGGRARLGVARALTGRAEVLLVRDVEALGPPDAGALLHLLAAIARDRRATVLVALASLGLAGLAADRVLAIADGALIFDGPPGRLGERADRRLTPLVRTGA
jgi:ABC-type phosphate/phosphonate transport system ATPase subunit